MIFGRTAMFRDPGTFWHTALGVRSLETRRLDRTDPYSFTYGGHSYINSEWLSQCLMATVHRIGGWDALLATAAMVLAMTLAAAAGRLVRAGLHLLPVLVLLALALGASSHQFHVRPLVVTMALTYWSFGLLVDVEAGRRRLGHLAWLIPLTVFWANAHGGVLAGLGTLGLTAVLWLVEGRWLGRGPATGWQAVGLIAAVVLGSLAAVLVNPNGLQLPCVWWEILRLPLPGVIQEHSRLAPLSGCGLLTLLLGGLYTAVLVTVPLGRLRASWLLPLVWLALACLRIRNAPLLAITALVALADVLPASRLGRWLESRDLLRRPPDDGDTPSPQSRSTRWPLVPLTLLAAALALTAVRSEVRGGAWVRFDPARWPVDLLPRLQAIEANQSGAPIFNDMLYGGFLIYHTPGLKVFLDDRCEVYGRFVLEYDRARRDDPGRIEAWRAQYGFCYALVEAGSAWDDYLGRSPQWRAIGRGGAGALYRFAPQAAVRTFDKPAP